MTPLRKQGSVLLSPVLSRSCWIVFIVLSIGISEVRADPSFIEEPADTQVRSGDEGRLRCILAGIQPNVHCFWNKDGGQIEIMDRYQYTSNPDAGDCSISITDSNMNFDDGIWTCGVPQTSSQAGLKSRDARYQVLLAPKDPIISSDGVQVANGSDLLVANYNMPPKILCKSENGNPAADLQWTLSKSGTHPDGNLTIFNDTMTNNKTQTAVLQLTQQMDDSWQGEILACVANHPSYDYNHVAYVYVRNPQSPEQVTLTSDVTTSNIIQADTHDYITLYCHANGYPVPTYRWNNRILQSDDWVIYTNNQGPNITFQAFDSQFMCEATNDDVNYYQSEVMEINTTSASSAQIGTIITIVVVCVVVVILMLAGVYACYRKKVWPFNAGGNKNKNQNGNLETARVEEPKIQLKTDDVIDEQARRSLINEEMETNNRNAKRDSSPQVR